MSRDVVLVVDDHESGRFAKSQVLKRAGFVVVEAGTGSEALQRVYDDRPDAILLDVNLPDISGLEVSRRVRSSEGDVSAIPILQVSSTAVSTAEQVKGLEFGADAYITEPIDADVLIATVRALVRARRAERDLALALQRERAARVAAEEANATKNDFIATLSHELRTPLNALLGSVWQLRHTAPDEPARQRALDRIERSAAAQARLINDLLDLSRIAKGKLTLSLGVVDVATILDDSVDAVRPAAAQKNLVLHTAWERAHVIADANRLQQIFVNLLTNAVQFTPPGGTISVTSAPADDHVVVQVADSGAGIAADFLPLVFEQFRQGEAGMSRKHGGLGLGLAVVKQLIELHDGDVSVESEGADRGSSFSVRLPRETTPPEGRLNTGPALDAVHALALDVNLPGDLSVVLTAAGAELDAVATLSDVLTHLPEAECDAIVAPEGVLTEASLANAVDRRGLRPVIVPAGHADNPAAVVRRLSRMLRARAGHQLAD